MASDSQKFTLKSADDKIFVVEEPIAMEMVTVKCFFEDNSPDDAVVPLPNVSSEPLTKIIAYCRKHAEFRSKFTPEEEVRSYDEGFVKEQDNEEIKEMILAANYLNVKSLLDFLNQAVADRIKNKSVEYVRKFFGIEGDFTTEEEAQLRQENQWAFEGVDAD